MKLSQQKIYYWTIGVIVFLIALASLVSTVQPSVSFWDCGELSAASYGLQVTHPPGAPFFILINKVFSLLPIAANIGLRINLMTVFFSSLSILFLYMVTVKLIENFMKPSEGDFFGSLMTYLSAAVAALAFAFCDTFWFNGVESNVFGFSTFLFAAIVMLAMLWNENSEKAKGTKYLLLIAFLIGLSPGVHLMSVPAIMPVVMMVVFKKYVIDEEYCKKTGYIFIGHMALLLIIAIILWAGQTGSQRPTQEEITSFDHLFLLLMIIATIAYILVFRKYILNRNSFYFPVVVGVVALAVAFPGIVKYLTQLLGIVSGENMIVAVVILFLILGLLAYFINRTRINNKPILNITLSSLFLMIIGFSVYTTVVIRANQNPPMNENKPDNLKDLLYYLGREQYGEMPFFKRRYSLEPQHEITYKEYKSDLDFFWNYQMQHMFNRYLGWNFIGKESFDQDSGIDFKKFFMLPFLLAIAGIVYHFRRDWKMASVFLMMFIIMGYAIAYYQVQQNPQPRERIYFYGGAFFTFSVWIGIGLRGILQLIRENVKSPLLFKGISIALLILAFLAVPYNMYSKNRFTHDRSRNWLPWDYAYNLLQSCEPNAVLFTCGDNDTFQLWYMQDVEGVRRDVRVANLSLINTNWYPKQLKNESPYGSMKVAMSYSDAEIDRITSSATPFKAQDITIPVPKSAYEKFGITDTSITNQGKITFRMKPTINNTYVRASDLFVKDIIVNSKWERPVYFCITCTDDYKIGLDGYLRLEGYAYRVVPFKMKNDSIPNVDVEKTVKHLIMENPSYSQTYQLGSKYRGLNDSTIFYDDNMVRSVNSYIKGFTDLAFYYIAVNDTANCKQVLKKMDEYFPPSIFPKEYFMITPLLTLYEKINDTSGYIATLKQLEQFLMRYQKRFPDNRELNNELNKVRELIQMGRIPPPGTQL
jgi:hypothetical protein